jgi:hypothetical protein
MQPGQTAAGSGSIQGTVVNEVTREPIRKAVVTLNYGNTPSAVTDSTGRFVFQKVPAGSYMITAQNPASPTRYPMSQTPSMITLGQDEQKRNVVIPLTPGASISGRIVDEDGKPLTGCSVQALEFAHGQGDRRLNATQGGNSDDRGQYRLQGLAKGRYNMFVQCGKRLPSPHGFIRRGADMDVPMRVYPPRFYPASQDLAGATRINLAAGVDLSGVDFRMTPVNAVSVFGQLTGVPEGLNRVHWLRLTTRDLSVSNFVNYGSSWNDPRRGTFRIEGVPPGSYTLIATAQDQGHISEGRLPVDVGAESIGPINLPLISGADYTGTMEIEGDTAPGIENAQVRLMRLEPDFSGNWPNAKVEKDGTFSLTGVLPGRWRMEFSFGASYTKSFWLGDTQVSPYGFNVPPGAGGKMRLIVSTKMAEIEGSVDGTRPLVANPLWVIAVPEDPERWAAGRTWNAAVGEDNHFRFSAEPGRYRLYSFGGIAPGMIEQNAQVLKAIEDRSAQVEAEEGDHIMVQVQIIPAEELKKALQEEDEK